MIWRLRVEVTHAEAIRPARIAAQIGGFRAESKSRAEARIGTGQVHLLRQLERVG